jgi:hypothetical protein
MDELNRNQQAFNWSDEELVNEMDEASKKNLQIKKKYGKQGPVKGGETTIETANRYYEGIHSVISSIGPAFRENSPR